MFASPPAWRRAWCCITPCIAWACPSNHSSTRRSDTPQRIPDVFQEFQPVEIIGTNDARIAQLILSGLSELVILRRSHGPRSEAGRLHEHLRLDAVGPDAPGASGVG